MQTYIEKPVQAHLPKEAMPMYWYGRALQAGAERYLPPGLGQNIVAGYGGALAGTGEAAAGMVSPANVGLAFAPAGLATKGIAAVTTAQAMEATPERYHAMMDAYRRGDWAAFGEHAAALGTSYLGALGFFSKGKAVSTEVPGPRPPGVDVPPVQEAPAGAAKPGEPEVKTPEAVPKKPARVETDEEAQGRYEDAIFRMGKYGVDVGAKVNEAASKGGITWQQAADLVEAEEAKIPEQEREISLRQDKTLQELRVQRDLVGRMNERERATQREVEDKGGPRALNEPMQFDVKAIPTGGFLVRVNPRSGQIEVPGEEIGTDKQGNPRYAKPTIKSREIPGGTFFLPKEGGELQPLKGGELDAIKRRNAQVETRQAPQREQTRPGSPVTETGGGDNVVRTPSGEAPRGNVPGEQPVPASERPVAATPAPTTPVQQEPAGGAPGQVAAPSVRPAAKQTKYVVRETRTGAVLRNLEDGSTITFTAEDPLDPISRLEAVRKAQARLKELDAIDVASAVDPNDPEKRAAGGVPVPRPISDTSPGLVRIAPAEPFSTKRDFKRVPGVVGMYTHKDTGLVVKRNPEGGWDVRDPKTGETIDNLGSRQEAMEAYAHGWHTPARTVEPEPAMTDAQMSDVALKTFKERPVGAFHVLPRDGMDKGQIISRGREAIEKGVDPQKAFESTTMEPDVKYGIVRAQSENLREAAHAWDQAARRKPTADNVQAANDAFFKYYDWDRNQVATARKNAMTAFPEMEQEVAFDPHNFTDMRLQMMKVNGKDFNSAQKATAEKQLAKIQKSQGNRLALIRRYEEELYKLAPHANTELKTPNDAYNFTAEIMKRKFPCK
jgi:hypothetical protein